MSQYWLLSPQQCQALMDNHDIPTQAKQRKAFARVFRKRLDATLTEKEVSSAYLIPGRLPPDWQALLLKP